MRIVKLLLVIALLFNTSLALATDYTADANAKLMWLMNVDEDPIQDSSSNNKDGTLTSAGNPDYTSAGKFDGGYLFNGAENISSPTGVFSGSGNISYGCWIKSSQAVGNDTNTHVINIGEAAADKMWHIILYRASTGVYQIKFGLWAGLSITNFVWNDDAWHHLFVVYNGSTVILYTDGTANSTNDSGSNITDLAVVLGNYRGDATGTNFDYIGSTDEVAILNRNLSSTEVNEIMDNGLKPAVTSVLFGGEAFVFD